MFTQQEMRDRSIMEEYYSFLYELATKKKYEHSSQLTSEEKIFCEKLLSRTKSSYRENKLYLTLMKTILRY